MAHDTYTQDGMLLYSTNFTALNNSGIAGKAVLLVDQNTQTLTVDIQATGLEANQLHIQHIHGFTDGTDSQSPTLAQDTDGDGFVELGEGLPVYGDILLNLTMNPENSVHDHGAGHDHTDAAVFPTVGADGKLSYHEVFNFGTGNADANAIFNSIIPLELKEIVLHGETTTAVQGAGTPGEVDGTLGYKLALPVASGELMGVAPAADVLAAVQALGVDANQVVDWNAIGEHATANFEATGHWFI
jgi:hypothetical protein